MARMLTLRVLEILAFLSALHLLSFGALTTCHHISTMTYAAAVSLYLSEKRLPVTTGIYVIICGIALATTFLLLKQWCLSTRHRCSSTCD